VSAAKASTTRDLSASGRGGGWVVAQLVLFALIVGSWFFGPGVTRLGWIVALTGAVVVGAARWAMGRSFTAFPVPKPDGELIVEGPYSMMRHPMYVGGVFFFAGLSLVFSAWALVLTAVLGLFWIAKARREERHLLKRFRSYAAYRRRTWF
jgi:protein-S-isoprenylcysteine O-methyltransferase Ste14